MDALSLFGLFAVTAMLACYALEDRSHWFVLAFAAACAPGSVYGFLAVWTCRGCLGSGRAAALGRQAALECIACRHRAVLISRTLRQRCPPQILFSPEVSRPCGRTAD